MRPSTRLGLIGFAVLIIVTAAGVGSGFLVGAGERTVGALSVRNVWVRAMPPGGGMTAGYFEIENGTAKPVRLVGVSSALFSSVDIHETVVRDKVASMSPVGVLVVPVGGKVSLRPGGMHLMMMGGRTTLKEGDLVPLTLTFEEGARLVVDAPVSKNGAGLALYEKSVPFNSGECVHPAEAEKRL